MMRRPPRSPLFPYTTLVRSRPNAPRAHRRRAPAGAAARRGRAQPRARGRRPPGVGALVLALEDCRDSHPSCSTNRDEPPARAAIGKLLREPGDDARAGGAERMSDGDAAALRVHLAAV